MAARRSIRPSAGLLLFTTLAAMTVWASAFAQTNLEYAVKATYLVRFAAFADWPASAFADEDAPLVICVAGRDPFGAALDQAARGQSAGARPLRVRRVGGDAGGCHILYLGDGASVVSPSQGLLLVSDAAAGRRGGAIHFVVSQGRVRFHVDLRPARQAGVTLSSRLLNLALTVEGR